MCAIAGIFSREARAYGHEFEIGVRRMNKCQSRRGPDDEGLYGSGPVILGNRRLAIIDLSPAGHQPMNFKTKEGGNLWITFNGEIYNFESLRESLKDRGYVFRTRTDTEVILALYAEYGEASFAMLRGMFALAIWDEDRKRIILSKDRYGIKPLYYFKDKDKLVFASEVKALRESGFTSTESDPRALIGFLLFGSVPVPFTTIKSIRAVPAGHYLIFDGKNQEKLVKYYDPLAAFLKKKEVGAAGAIRDAKSLLEESIRLHLISDAPLGVFLSGGLDSSAIAALATKSRENSITTLSIIFDEKEFSEEYYSDLVAQKIGSDHRKIKITKQDFYDSLEEIFEAMDQPTVNGVNTFFVSWAAKKARLKAVLSGLGGDEIFLGYPSFKRAALLRGIQGLPNFVKQPLRLFSFLGDRYAKLGYFVNSDIFNFYLGVRGLFPRREAAKILDASESEINNFIVEFGGGQLQEIKQLERLSPVDLLSYLEIKFYLQNQLLKDTDFMSMYHSVEVRVPFLDHPLVEYLSGADSRIKTKGRVNKPLLARAVQEFLPPEILSRRKIGFTFPFAMWMKQMPKKDVLGAIPVGLLKQFESGKLHWSRFWVSLVTKKFLPS